jgi:lysophospholipase L1-like esterase
LKRISIAVLAALSALAVLAPAASASVRAPLNVVALGDSYGSGTGAGDYQPGTEGICWRSNNSYSEVTVARLRAEGRQVTYRDVACSGAAIGDLSESFKGEPAQLDALARDTNVVLLTIGIGDIDFAAYGSLCIQGDCTGAPTQAALALLPALGANLSTLFKDIRARSPRAKIVLSAYGQQLSPTDNPAGAQLDPICGPGVVTGEERTQGNIVAEALDLTLRITTNAARAKGIDTVFVSPYTNSVNVGRPFAGHSLCETGTPFYRGFDALAPGQEGSDAVLHLTKDGQAALAGLIRQKVPELAC